MSCTLKDEVAIKVEMHSPRNHPKHRSIVQSRNVDPSHLFHLTDVVDIIIDHTFALFFLFLFYFFQDNDKHKSTMVGIQNSV